MMLCVDAGNTRLKWGVAGPDGVWLETGHCEADGMAELAALPSRFPTVRSVWLSNVAGPKVEADIRSALHLWQDRLQVAVSTAAAAGVENGYAQPAQLGVDRWCAVLAAWHRQQRATLVVGLGTASTVDALDDHGRFLGGMILPGVSLMQHSLAARTAQLPRVTDRWLDETWHWPQDTETAIRTGTLLATVGAIEAAWQRLAAQASEPPVCVLTGGAAAWVEPLLALPHVLAPHAVLDGLRLLAQSAEKT